MLVVVVTAVAAACVGGFFSFGRRGGDGGAAAAARQATVLVIPPSNNNGGLAEHGVEARRPLIAEHQRARRVFQGTLSNPAGTTRGYIEPSTAPAAQPALEFRLVGEAPVDPQDSNRAISRTEIEIFAEAINLLCARLGGQYCLAVQPGVPSQEPPNAEARLVSETLSVPFGRAIEDVRARREDNVRQDASFLATLNAPIPPDTEISAAPDPIEGQAAPADVSVPGSSAFGFGSIMDLPSSDVDVVGEPSSPRRATEAAIEAAVSTRIAQSARAGRSESSDPR